MWVAHAGDQGLRNAYFAKRGLIFVVDLHPGHTSTSPSPTRHNWRYGDDFEVADRPAVGLATCRPEEPYTNSVRTVLWEPGRATVPATRPRHARARRLNYPSVGCSVWGVLDARGFGRRVWRSSVISEEDLMDIRALSRRGYTYAEIGRMLGRDWRTVKRYLEEGAQPVYRRKRMPSKLDPLKPRIDQWLAAQPVLLATRVHQDLVAITGSRAGTTRSGGISNAQGRSRSVGRRNGSRPGPGSRHRSDWSHEQPIRTSSGLELPLYCFHMVLGHSRDSFCRLTGSQDLVTFWACHHAAFTHFGGVPHELLYDRTKTVVRQHVGRDVTLEERIFHPEALASAHHYGFSMRLCQAYRAKTKGKVESDVPWVRERRLRGAQLHQLRGGEHRLAVLERRGCEAAGSRHSRRDRRRPRRARSRCAAAAAADLISGRRPDDQGRGA
jgi:transposase